MIEGIQHTPTQADSHAELQARQGWSVKDMREEIDSIRKEFDHLKHLNKKTLEFWALDLKDRDDTDHKKDLEIERLELFIDGQKAEINSLKAENEALKKEIYNVRNHWSQYNTLFFSKVRNALSYLNLVNCGNTSQALVNCAKLELLDIDKRRNAIDVNPPTKTLTAGEMAQDQTCFIEVSTLAPFDSSESDDYVLFHIKSVEGGYIQLHKSKPVVMINDGKQ